MDPLETVEFSIFEPNLDLDYFKAKAQEYDLTVKVESNDHIHLLEITGTLVNLSKWSQEKNKYYKEETE